MPSHNEPVQPAQFKAVQPVQAAGAIDDNATGASSHHWVPLALGGLLVVALLVFFWLPGQVKPPEPTTQPDDEITQQAPEAGSAPRQASTLPEPAATTASPWSDARQARLRREAQDALAQLLDLQFKLEERGAQRWGGNAFSAVEEIARAGDAAYREQEYEQATAHYATGLAALTDLQDSIPQRWQGLLDDIEQALQAGAADEADAALELAAALEPDSPALPPLRSRLVNLEPLMALLQQAGDAEAAGDLGAAQTALQEAVTLDSKHLGAASELVRVTALERQAQFRAAMSRGYFALDEGRYDEARSAFTAAQQLQPGAEESASALLEVATARASGRLAALKSQGSRSEQGEQWQAAVSAYQRALNIDSNVLFAREGLARSQQRAALDSSLREILEQPVRLTDPRVAAEAAALLRNAAGAAQPRGRLDQQAKELSRLLERANTPVTVTLKSDEATEVIVHRVARLGRFEQHNLSLRPGHYTAVGSRTGFRDVRRPFTVGLDGSTETVTIICTERI